MISVGLRNQEGEYNCFLNSVIQVLWHLDVFRRNFHLLSGHACLENSCIFCALKVIFTQFQFSESATLPPDALRRSMAIAFSNESRFQLGEMDDASECFEKILSQLHYHMTGTDQSETDNECSQPCCLTHRKFVTNVIEEMICQCNATCSRLAFGQTVSYVSASSVIYCASSRSVIPDLRDVQAVDQLNNRLTNGHREITEGTRSSFGQLVRDAMNDNGYRRCSRIDCRGRVQLRRTLVTPCPDVVSIGLIWDVKQPSSNDIDALMSLVDTSLRPTQLFDFVVDHLTKRSFAVVENFEDYGEEETFKLSAIVCYYGKHYSSFLFDRTIEGWVSIDDSNITQIGQWSEVLNKLVRGRYRPLMLIYANRLWKSIDRTIAPRNIWVPFFGKQAHHQSATASTEPFIRPSSARPPKKTSSEKRF